MSGGAYKVVRVRDTVPGSPSLAQFRAGRPLQWEPFASLLENQDRVVGSSRRVVASFGMFAGEETDHVPHTDSYTGTVGTPADMLFPLDYLAHTTEARLTPGNFLECRLIALPSGNTQVLVGGGQYAFDGAQGAAVLTVTFAKGASSETLEYRMPLVPSTRTDGAYDAGVPLRRSAIFQIVPSDSTPAGAEEYAEWCTATITMEIYGGARPLDWVVYERGWYHAQAATPGEQQSCHAFVLGGHPPQFPQTEGPQEARADGGTAEARFGTHQTLDVVERQSERLGPRVFDWSSWSPSNISYTTGQEPLELTGTTTYVDAFDATITSWAQSNPGWLVEGAGAQLWRYCDGSLLLGASRAVVPVRVGVRANMASGDVGTATFKLQSSETEIVEVEVSGTTTDWFYGYGFLQCQRAGDQVNAGNCQLFYLLSNASETVELYDVFVEFGDW